MVYFTAILEYCTAIWSTYFTAIWEYFTSIWYILWPFWYIYYSRYGMVYQEKSGNPESKVQIHSVLGMNRGKQSDSLPFTLRGKF
jgi:hypothetical protein